MAAHKSSDEIITGVTAAAGRIDKVLADQLSLSRERIKQLLLEGMVSIADTPTHSASAKIAMGTPFKIAMPPVQQAAAHPQDIPLDIVYEDEDVIVINKGAGMVVHPAAGNYDGTLVNALLYHCQGRLSGINGIARPGIVHRIDKDTSGLLVVAKHDSAHEGLAQQFADHTIHRRYIAVCAGRPNPGHGTINARLGRSDTNRKKMAVLPDNATRGKHAVTHYAVKNSGAYASVVECRLETGRTHQVRVHMAHIGHPLLGDPVYGKCPAPLRPVLAAAGFARQALHAAELGFLHPITGENHLFTCPIPADMRGLIDETI